MAQKDLLSVIQQLMETSENAVNKKNQVDKQDKQKTSPDTQGVLGKDGKALDAGGDKDVGGSKGDNASDASSDTQGVLGQKGGAALNAGGDKDVGGKKGSNASAANSNTQGVLGKTSGKALDAGGDKDVGKLKEAAKMKEGNAVAAKAAAAKNAGKSSFELDGKKMPVTMSDKTAKKITEEEDELVGGQKKLDVNGDGKISADDLKKVRQGQVKETSQNDANAKSQVDTQPKQKTSSETQGVLGQKGGAALNAGGDKDVGSLKGAKATVAEEDDSSPDTQGVLGKKGGAALNAGGDKDVGKLKEGTVELSIEVDADQLMQIAQSGADSVDLGDIESDEDEGDGQDEVPGDATDLPPDAAGPEAGDEEEPGMEPQDGEEPDMDGESEEEPEMGGNLPPAGDADQDGMPNDAETDDDGDGVPDDQEDADADDVPDDMEKEPEEEGTADPVQKIAELEAELDALKKQLGQSEEEDSGLEEDFKQKATIIFETAVNQKVGTIREQLEEQYASKMEKELAAANAKINEYVDYAVKEWVKENQLEIKYSLRTEIAENFIRGLKGLFEENYIEIPDDEVSVVDELTEAVESYKEQLEEQAAVLEEAQAELLSIKRHDVFEEVAEGMTETQKIRLEKLSESVEAADIDEFRFKVEQLKESFFDGTSESPLLSSLSEEVFGNTRRKIDEDSPVSQYASFLSRTVLK